jgi:hypothetical protein
MRHRLLWRECRTIARNHLDEGSEAGRVAPFGVHCFYFSAPLCVGTGFRFSTAWIRLVRSGISSVSSVPARESCFPGWIFPMDHVPVVPCRWLQAILYSPSSIRFGCGRGRVRFTGGFD